MQAGGRQGAVVRDLELQEDPSLHWLPYKRTTLKLVKYRDYSCWEDSYFHCGCNHILELANDVKSNTLGVGPN